MKKFSLKIYLSYSQICIFESSLSNPFNNWSDKSFNQGFSWRDRSVSFRTLLEEGNHLITIFINEPIPELDEDVVRAFKVPLDTSDGNIEIASISDSIPLKIPEGKYVLQIEFLTVSQNKNPEVNIRLNKGETSFLILKADNEIYVDEGFDINSPPAI